MKKPWIAAAAGLVLLLGCSSDRHAGGSRPAATLFDGPGALVSVNRHLAIWATVRASAVTRSKGWAEPIVEPVIIIYDSRDLNPVFLPDGCEAVIVWVDGNHVMGVVPAARASGGFVRPPGAVTAALIAPLGLNTHGLTEGDLVTML